MAPVAVVPGRVLLPPIHICFSLNHVEVHQIVVIFNSLYLFSSKSINYKANGEAL